MDYVSRLLNTVNCLSEEKRKKIFSKIFYLTEAGKEFGAGDDITRHNFSEEIINNNMEYNTEENKIKLPMSKVNLETTSSIHMLDTSAPKPSSIASDCQIIFQATNVQTQHKQEFLQNWYFPEKVMESLLAGYCRSNHPQEVKSEINSQNQKKLDDKDKLKKSFKNKLVSDGKNKIKSPVAQVSGEEQIVHIYDCKGNPLTDCNGVPLKNVKGELLVKFLNGKPDSTLNGKPVFDKNSLPFVKSLDQALYNIKQEPLRLFNQDGIPLTDENGFALKLVNGKYAIHLDKYNRLVSDSSGRPLFDETGRQITSPQTELFCKQQSTAELAITTEYPMLYNDKSFLLTNSSGRPLIDVNGNPVTVDHKTGAIIRDNKDLPPVYDVENNVCQETTMRNRKNNKTTLTLYDCNKYPLTTSNGNILFNVEGKEMVIFDNRGKPVKDYLNRLIYDAAGHPSNSDEFNPYFEATKKHKSESLKIKEQVYDFRGYPLLDFDFSPLTTADGKELVVCNNKGELVHDANGNPIFDSAGIPMSKLNGRWTTPQAEPFRVFDSTGFPLTSEIGEDLYDINSTALLKTDHLGRPILSLTEAVVFDVHGVPSTHVKFNPSQSPLNTGVTRKVYMYNKPMKIYNKYGMPLTDAVGTAMTDANGKDLIEFDKHGIPIKDYKGDKLFDEFKIPLNCQKNQPILSMYGKPIRLYDQKRRPLTDINGIPLNLANGSCMIKFDNAGRPVSDFRNSELFDFNGRNLHDHNVNPELFTEMEHIQLLKKDGQPVLVYNREGMPLTDSSGIILMNSDGTHMFLNSEKVPVSDYNGDPVYDETGQPWIKTMLLNESEEIIEEKDPFGRPLRDRFGEAQFDNYGRPLYDLYRRRLYDEEGQPVANAYGRFLVNNLPESKDVDLGFDLAILNGSIVSGNELITDLIGGPIFDHVGMPLYNQHGKPLIDRYGRPLYDENGLPLCDQFGKPVSLLVRQNGNPVDVKDLYKPIEVTKEVADLIDNTVLRTRITEQSPCIPGIWILPANVDNTDNVCPTHPEKKMYWALLRMTTFEDGKKSFEILEAKPYNPDS
ncbi:uncharacterized protein isoform X2 [Rhodnius prolixus]